jgi:hypothetical protein
MAHECNEVFSHDQLCQYGMKSLKMEAESLILTKLVALRLLYDTKCECYRHQCIIILRL